MTFLLTNTHKIYYLGDNFKATLSNTLSYELLYNNQSI